MKTFHRGLGAALMLCSSSLFAAPYISAAVARTQPDLKESDADAQSAVGFSLAGGYQLDTLPLFFELGYLSTGKIKVEYADFDPDRYTYRGGLAQIGAALPIEDRGRVWLQGGYYLLKGKVDNGFSSDSRNTRGASVGAGAEYMVADGFGLRFDVQRLLNVQVDLTGFGNQKEDSMVYRVGAVFYLGDGDKSLRFPPNPSATGYSPRSPAVASTPATEATVVASVLKRGDEALARPGSVLRAAPLESSEVIQNLSPSPVLKLESSIVNASGEWWFVVSDIERGWLRAEELLKP